MKSSATKGKRLIFTIIIAMLVPIAVLSCIFFSIYFSVKLDKNAIIAERAQITLIDGNNMVIDEDYFNRYVKYEDINSDIINAFVALEDKRFFRHKGVDYYRTMGALVNNIKAGYSKEGGSTITQQLAKNTHLSQEKTIIRKIKEMKLARDIEKAYSKEEILEMYLNAIYYGNGVYGIDSACKTYFDKSPSELSIAESALLAGIVKSPQKYSPVNDREKAEGRMKIVLKLMLDQNYINEQEYEDALCYEYKKPLNDNFSPYFAAVIHEASAMTGMSETELIKSPITIYTYYDGKAQNALNTAYKSGEYNLVCKDGSEAYSSAMLANNTTGGIVAYYSNKKFNPITTRRQPGSTIKPLAVYAPALNCHIITEADSYIDEKTDFGGYCPANYKDIYIGNTDVETALTNSINTVAVKIYSENEREYCLKSLEKSGITLDKNDNNLALALGGMTNGVTATELIEGYMTLANAGIHTECGFIRELKRGNVSLYTKNPIKERVFDEDAAYITTDMLIKTAKYGTAKKLNSLPYEIAAKTGTVSRGDGNNDAWCISYTPTNTLCVWYGGEDYSEEKTIKTTGGGMPTLLSRGIYSLLNLKNTYFTVPECVVELEIDTLAREQDGKIMLANICTPKEYRKAYCFSVKNCPTEYSPYFINDTADLAVTNENGNIKLYFEQKYPFLYKIYREDLLNGNQTLLYEYAPDIAKPNDTYTDSDAVRNKAYLYTVEVYCNGILIGMSISNAVLT